MVLIWLRGILLYGACCKPQRSGFKSNPLVAQGNKARHEGLEKEGLATRFYPYRQVVIMNFYFYPNNAG